MDLGQKPDVVIIGAGAGGAAMAWRLCSHGLQVLLLEAGPRLTPSSDYHLHRPDWEKRGFPSGADTQGAFSIAPLQALSDEYSDLRSWSRTRGLLGGDRRRAMGPGYSHVQAVGGSTLHYVGEAHRMHERSLRLKSEFGVGADWPLTYQQLEPYYTQAEVLIGVAGPSQQAGRPRSTPFPLPEHPFSPASQQLVQAGFAQGMNWQANSRAALSRPYDGRPSCNYCANCNRGCPIGDKGSADVTFIRKAEQTGNLQIKSSCPVVQIKRSPDGRITSVVYIEMAQRHEVEASIFVVSTGAVQTPRLLLANGLAKSSDQVGRNFMETLYWQSAGLLPGLSHSHVGLQSDAICWDFNAPDAIPDVVGGCRFHSSTTETGLNGPVGYASRLIGGFGQKLKQDMREQFGSAIAIAAIGEFLPNEQSYVDLDPEQRDQYGMPVARIHSFLADAEIMRMRFMANTCRAVLKHTGATLVEEISSYDFLTATHVFGTCRMGVDATDSVVDEYCRTHDHDNLFIVDASVFPSSGGGESPSLTISALAMRSADAIAKGLRG